VEVYIQVCRENVLNSRRSERGKSNRFAVNFLLSFMECGQIMPELLATHEVY
jgi:hypothetical protein